MGVIILLLLLYHMFWRGLTCCSLLRVVDEETSGNELYLGVTKFRSIPFLTFFLLVLRLGNPSIPFTENRFNGRSVGEIGNSSINLLKHSFNCAGLGLGITLSIVPFPVPGKSNFHGTLVETTHRHRMAKQSTEHVLPVKLNVSLLSTHFLSPRHPPHKGPQLTVVPGSIFIIIVSSSSFTLSLWWLITSVPGIVMSLITTTKQKQKKEEPPPVSP